MTAQDVGLFLAGIVAPFLVQAIKGLGIADRWAQWLTLAVCAILATVAIALTGGFTSTPDAAVKAGAVFALATLIYRQGFKPRLQP